MTEQNIILQELNELNSSLAGIYGGSLKPVFTVPEAYFSEFPGKMLEIARSAGLSVRDELQIMAPALAQSPRQTPFTVPGDYFENLDPMAVVQEPVLSPLLEGLRKQPTFRLPEGYLEGQQVRKEPGKLVQMPRFNWKKMAAAAVIISFVSVSAFFFMNRNADNQSDPNTPFVMQGLSPREMDEVIELADTEMIFASTERDRNAVSRLMQDVPEQEIIDFLNATEGLDADPDDDILLN